MPGIDTPEALDATDPIRLNDLSRNDEERAAEPVVVIDAKSGERWPIWVEIDSNASTPEETALLIHPARNFDSGRRYIVALRNLMPDAYYYEEGLEAPDGFRYYRDDLPSKDAAINSQRERFDRVFRNLREAGIKRSNLYLAWDFTVASDENIAERMLAIRDDAFAELGDEDLDDEAVAGDAPEFDVTSVENFTIAQDPELARRVLGTFEVPCYLEPNCNPGGTFDLGQDGLPQRNGTYTANFHCGIPRKAVDAPADARAGAGLRPRAARDALPGDLGRPADPGTDAQLRDLRDRHDRLLGRRRREHRVERPAAARQLPAADRPGPAGPPQHALPWAG